MNVFLHTGMVRTTSVAVTDQNKRYSLAAAGSPPKHSCIVMFCCVAVNANGGGNVLEGMCETPYGYNADRGDILTCAVPLDRHAYLCQLERRRGRRTYFLLI